MILVEKGRRFISGLKTWFLATSFKQKLIIGVIIVAVGLLIYKITHSSSQQPQYQTAQVTKGSIISTVSGNGSISGNQINITSPTDGIIEELYVNNAEEVTAGENLFKVKSTATAQEQASAYATYQSSISSLTTAKENKQTADATMWTKQQALLDAQNTVDYKNNNTTNPTTKVAYTELEKRSIDAALTQAQKDFSATEQKFKEADVAIVAAQAQANASLLAYQATQNAVVKAPVSGTVANVSIAIGSSVTSSSNNSSNTNSSATSTSTSSNSSSPVLVIGNFSRLQIKVQVSEVDIAKIKSGQKATITLDAYPDKTFVGTVSNVDLVGTINSGVVTYNVYVGFISPPADVYPGMSASVTIQTDRKDDVLTVPSSAIQTANGQSTVRVLKKGIVTQAPVETGISSDTDTEILSGLSEGDTIVTSTTTRARTGQQTTSPFSGFGGGRGGLGGGTFFRGR